MIADVRQELAPATSEAEKGLLGSLLFDPSCVFEASRTVAPADFADTSLRAVYESVLHHHGAAGSDGQALVARVLPDLRNNPAVDEPKGLLLDIHNSVVGAAHAATYAAQVRDLARGRRLKDAAEDVLGRVNGGQDPAEVMADLRAFVEDEDRAVGAGVPKFSLGDLCTNYPKLRPPIVDGLFRQGDTVNVVAAPKTGKSWAVYGLSLSIVTGRPWLDHFDTTRGRVLLVDAELHPDLLANRIPRVAEAMDVSMADAADGLEVWPLRGQLRSLDDLQREFDRVTPGEFAAIVFDAKYRFLADGVSENDNAQEARFYNQIDAIAQSTGAACVLVHHASKGDQSGKAVTDIGAGAGAQSRAPDAHLVMRPHEEPDCVVLDGVVRSFQPIDPIVVRWEWPLWVADPLLDPERLKGRTATQKERRGNRDAEAEEQRENDAIKVLAAMQKLSRPETVAMIAGAAKLTHTRTKSAIGLLTAQQQVEEGSVTRENNQRYSGYQITPNHSDSRSDSECPSEGGDTLSHSDP